MVPFTPARSLASDVVPGDTVDVPGGMQGTVRFVGPVQGKRGIFAGVELHPDYANRGKNSGDADGYDELRYPPNDMSLTTLPAVFSISPPTSLAQASSSQLPRHLFAVNRFQLSL